MPIRSLVMLGQILARLEQNGTGDLEVLLKTPGGWGWPAACPHLSETRRNIVNDIIRLQKIQSISSKFIVL